jgi:hypothetical protein
VVNRFIYAYFLPFSLCAFLASIDTAIALREILVFRFWARSRFLRWTLPFLVLANCPAFSFGVLHLRSASPSVEKNSLQVVTVESGPLICRVEGLDTLLPEDERWLSAGTDGCLDQVLLRPGAHIRPDAVILQLSNPDLDRQVTDAELAMKKSEVVRMDPNV